MISSPVTSPLLALKVDVDTYEGMRRGVPRLLDLFREKGVRATFFFAYGPDNSGKAIWNVFRQRGFLLKMLRTRALGMYGWRTALSGTLLPARVIGAELKEIVCRTRDEGHEVGAHGWDHRLWQDHLDALDEARIAKQYELACGAFGSLLGRAPRAAAAPAWYQTPTGLRVQDRLGLLYASDARDCAPGYPELDGYASITLQVPTTQPCLEELLTRGERDLDLCAERVLATRGAYPVQVLPLHAEVEGGPYHGFLERLLGAIHRSGAQVRTLEEIARTLLAAPEPPRRFRAQLRVLPGRSGRVLGAVR